VKSNARRAQNAAFLITLLVGIAPLLTGCASRTPRAPAKAAPPPTGEVKAPPAKHPLDLVGKVNGRGWYLPWYTRDPKKPNGPPIPVLIAEAETGEITKHNDNPEIVMRHVHARIYQKGVHSANVEAAKIRANQLERTVFASGGCTVTSLLNPTDTVLTADRITWDTENTRFVAEGHAHVERRPRDGGTPITQSGGKIVYDTEKNTVTVL